jgi:hypothetical protein
MFAFFNYFTSKREVFLFHLPYHIIRTTIRVTTNQERWKQTT